MGWGRRRGSISKAACQEGETSRHLTLPGPPLPAAAPSPPPAGRGGLRTRGARRGRLCRSRAAGPGGWRARPGPAAGEGRAGWEGRAGHSAGPTRGPRPAARQPAQGRAGQARAGGPADGRAGDGTKAPLLSGGRRRVTHNGGGSRLRCRRRARRGALPSRPAGAPRTRTHTHSRDFSGSSRECGARGQPPVSAQVSGCAGGSGVSEALALPQSPPCNPDPRERARERGRGLREPRPLASQAHSTGSPAPARPRALARAGISNAGDWAPRAAGAAGEARGLVSRPRWAGPGAGGEVG